MNRKDFFDPPLEARPTQRLIDIRPKAGTESAEIYKKPCIEDIAVLKELGFGGVSTQLGDEGYLDNEEGWEALRAQLVELRRLGMRAWIRDERGRPSGKAGGKAVARFPEGRALGLLHAFLPFEGPVGAILPIPAGKALSLSAVPLRDGLVYLSGIRNLAAVPGGETVKALLPEGSWMLAAFVERPLLEGTFANDPTSGEEPYINILDQEAVKAYIEVCHERHYEKLKDFFPDVVKGFHSDEPLLIASAFPSGKPFPPYPAVPWHRDMPELFRQRYGYDLIPFLTCLFHDAGPKTAVVRNDFYRLLGELCKTAFTEQLASWCSMRGVRHKLQSLGEETLVTQTAFEASLSSFVGTADLPCADLLSATYETFRIRDQTLPAVKMVSSAAFHHGRTDVEADFADAYQYRAGFECNREDLRGTIGWLFALGATSLNSLCVWRKRDPVDWKELTAFTGRLSLAVTGSSHVADLLLLSPLASVRAHYVPSTRYIMEPPIGSLERRVIWSESYAAEAYRWDLEFRELVWALMDRQWDFDVGEDEDLQKAESVGHALRLGSAIYRGVVVSPMDTGDPDTFSILKTYALGGGLVIGFYPPPTRSIRWGKEVKPLGMELFGSEPPPPRGYLARALGSGTVILVGDREGLLSALDQYLVPEVRLLPNAPGVVVIHRQREGEDLFVFSNPMAGTIQSDALFRCLGGLGNHAPKVEVWDPLSGSVKDTSILSEVGKPPRITLTLPCKSALLVRITHNG